MFQRTEKSTWSSGTALSMMGQRVSGREVEDKEESRSEAVETKDVIGSVVAAMGTGHHLSA